MLNLKPPFQRFCAPLDRLGSYLIKLYAFFSQVKTMKMDYIVSRIEASQDGSPYVYVTYDNPNDFKAGADRTPPMNSLGPQYDGIYLTRGVDEEFTKSNGKYF